MLPLLPANPSTALILVGGFGTRLRPLVNIPLYLYLFFWMSHSQLDNADTKLF